MSHPLQPARPQSMTTTSAVSGQHVIVIGAGYVGLMCALQLAPAVRVTLVDPAGYFTERVRSHERAAGRPDITHPLSGFLGPAGITHLPARVTALVPGAREIRTDDGHVLRYDRLVYALGTRTAGPAAAPAGHHGPGGTGPVQPGPRSRPPGADRPRGRPGRGPPCRRAGRGGRGRRGVGGVDDRPHRTRRSRRPGHDREPDLSRPRAAGWRARRPGGPRPACAARRPHRCGSVSTSSASASGAATGSSSGCTPTTRPGGRSSPAGPRRRSRSRWSAAPSAR